MDTSQFIAMVIGMVISTISKDVVKWCWVTLNKLAVTETIKAKVNAMFTKNNLDILFHLFSIGFYLYIATAIGWTDASISGKDLLIVVGCLAAAVFMGLSLLVKIAISIAKAKPT